MINDIIIEFFKKNGISLDTSKPFTLGNNVRDVYPATNLETGSKLVVKLGIDRVSRVEIEKNILGYKELDSMGVSSILPDTLWFGDFEGVPFIVMSHCGHDFYTAVQVKTKPDLLYKQLIVQVDELYRRTLRPCEGKWKVNELIDFLTKIYIDKLRGHVSLGVLEKIKEISFSEVTFPLVCFSSFDFTPEDVFVTENGLKYVDPKPPHLGIPIIDLACFAGVARDSHHLPGAGVGYALIHNYATYDLASLLELDHPTAKHLFSLGRAIQLGLSGWRWMKEGYTIRAKKMIDMSIEYALKL